MSAAPGQWVVWGRATGDEPRLRLLCFPHAGVGPSAYRLWRELLPDDIELLAVALPGRESRLRETPFTSMESLLHAAEKALEPWATAPYALFGHSMGAVMAYELARRFHCRGLGGPTHLFVSGHRAPQLAPRHPPLTHLRDDEFVLEIRRRYDGIPEEVLRHPDLLALLLPALKADLKAVESYVHAPGAPLECPITVLGGVYDPQTTLDELDAWAEQTRGVVTVRRFDGGHFYLQARRAEVVTTVVEALASTASCSGGSGCS